MSYSALGLPLTELTAVSSSALDEVEQIILTVETLSNAFFTPVTAESALFGAVAFAHDPMPRIV